MSSFSFRRSTEAARRYAAARAASFGAALVASVVGLGWLTTALTAAVRAPGPAPLDDVLGLAAAAAASGVLCWLTAGLAICLLAVRSGRPEVSRLAARLAPRAVHRLATALIGAGLLAAPAVTALPASAATGSPAPAATASVDPGPSESSPTGPLPDWTPDRPAPQPAPAATPHRPAELLVQQPRPRLAVAEDVVVRRGDTLWDIAARALGPRATVADIAVEWPRWYVANRPVVGPDPDLIRPGQRLRPPARH